MKPPLFTTVPAILVLMSSVVAVAGGPDEKRWGLKKSCAQWISDDPWKMAELDLFELMYFYARTGLKPEERDEIEREMIHRLAFKLLSQDEEKIIIQTLIAKDQDTL